jgi:tetratricopeptide (TPR) repeat protein
LGIELRKQGKWREAVAEYQRVLELVPDHAGLIYNMALACSDGGQTAEAHAWMQRALELEPTLPASGKNVAYNIGVIF